MAYTKYSLTPANNNAAPPDGAPEGMLPSAVNDTMRDMMAQIRDVGDGIRGGTYTMTAPVITGGSINGTTVGAGTASTGAFTTLGATGVATFSAGTVSAPAITTTGDTNTGIFFPAADTIAFTEGGVESVRIDSSGNVGLGVTPSAWSTANSIKALQIPSGALWNFSTNYLYLGQNYYWNGSNRIYINTDGASEYQQNAGTHIWFTAPSGTAGTTATLSERMRIDSSGNVGIGTSSPSTVGGLAVVKYVTLSGINVSGSFSDGINTTFQIGHSGSATTSLNTNGNNLTFGTGSTERMRIDSSGNVGIGLSNPTYRLQVAPGTYSDQLAVFNEAGTWTSNGGVVIADYYNNTTLIGGIKISAATTTSGFITFHTGGTTERMRIDSSGNLLVGGTGNASSGIVGVTYNGASLNGVALYNTDTGSANQYSFAFNRNGSLVGSVTNTNTATLYNTTSDYRLKNVIGAISDSGQRLDALEPIEYDFKVGGRTRGFLAHKFAEVYPNSVNGEKDAVDKEGKPVYQAMQASSSEVMADLIAEIQSLRKRVAQLESK
jgi:hypothetical protein